MNVFNKMNENDKFLILIRKLKDGFLSFIDDLLEVFPNNKKLFLQRVISYQLPDTVLYKILKQNINIDYITNKNEEYLINELCLLKNYENFINCEIFTFKELYKCNETIKIFNENIEFIWKWLNIIATIIKNIDNFTVNLKQENLLNFT